MDTGANTLVEEIEALFERGQHDTALELIEAYLDEHSDDDYARLVKAQMCLNLERQSAFVGKTLIELEPRWGDDVRFKRVHEQVAALLCEKLEEGRQNLARGYVRDAAVCFECAVELAPKDATVSLAVALALVESSADSHPSLSSFDLLEEVFGRQRPSLSKRNSNTRYKTDLIEKYLRLTLERSTSGEFVWQQATLLWARHQLSQGQLNEVLE